MVILGHKECHLQEQQKNNVEKNINPSLWSFILYQ